MTPATIFARLVARLRPMALGGPDIAANCRLTSKADAGRAPIIAPMRNSVGLPQQALSVETIIHRRAIRQNNRNPVLAARYVNRHMTLAKGA
jgi:hypothetical protein